MAVAARSRLAPAAAADWDALAARARIRAPGQGGRALRLPDRRLAADHPALLLAGHDRLLRQDRRRRDRRALALDAGGGAGGHRASGWRSMLAQKPPPGVARRGRRSRSSPQSLSPCWSAPTCTCSNFIFLVEPDFASVVRSRVGEVQRRGPVPERLARLRQLDPDRRRADGRRRHRRLARRLLPLALPVSRAAPRCCARSWCCTPSRC